jgi:citrate lyase subunit beta/citryl-CoA lyase
MRSLLFVPGDSARKLEKALGSGADALIVDLEDSVAPVRQGDGEGDRGGVPKGSGPGRRAAPPSRSGQRARDGLTDADLDGVMEAGPDGIMLPKAAGGPDVAHLGAKLAVREAEFGLPTAKRGSSPSRPRRDAACSRSGTYAGASRRLSGLTWGGEDLSADLGAEANRGEDGLYTDPYRIARALTLFGRRLPKSMRSTASTPTTATSTGWPGSAARRAGTASSPRWRSIRRRFR